MNARHAIFILALIALPAASTVVRGDEPPAARPRPNFVFILADDLGWADLGAYGADLHETPNLDRLAREGVRFTQAYAMSVCTPTRAAIMTGKHAARLHMTTWRESSVDRDAQALKSRRPLLEPVTAHDLSFSDPTIAQLLHDAGYLTWHVGKWHLGIAEHYPENHGFDLNIGGTLWGAPQSFFWPFKGATSFREPRYVPGLGPGKPGDELTDRLTDEALKLIETARDQDRPFFLNLWHHAVHTPIEARPELVERYQARLRNEPGSRHQNAAYAALVHTLDTNVGRVLDALKRLGLDDRTVVVFASDNGGYINAFQGQRVTNNAPLRSGKGSLYEGGIRVPLIVRAPGLTRAGATCDAPVICMDLFPTLAELAGITGPASTSIDGLSLVPLLREPAATLDRPALYFHYPHYYATTTPASAIRAGSWKLIEYVENDRSELYNLADDPGESVDLAARHPDTVRELRAQLHTWRQSVGAPLPLPNPNAKAAPSPTKPPG